MSHELLGKDLMLFDSLYGKDFVVQNGDLALADGVDNLVQALSLRLSNHRGILARLGHPNYGSRLPEAIGIINNRANLRIVENLVKEAILQEPRVKSIESVNIRTNPAQPGTIEIEVSILSILETVPLNLVVTIQSGNE